MNAKGYFDEVARGYDNEFSEYSIWSIAHRIGWKLLMRHLITYPEKVVDVGCGTGQWGRVFAQNGSQVTFVDISPRMVDQAITYLKNRGIVENIKGYCLPIEEMHEIESGSFDVTLCMGDPLSYCNNYIKGISELVRITKHGGFIFTSVDSRLGYLRVFKDRDGYELDKLQQFIETGDIQSWENLNIHTFRPDELRESFLNASTECVGIWGLPTLSAYFLFDPKFRSKLLDKTFTEKLEELELKVIDWGHPSGTHHLYGLFRKEGSP